MKVLHSVQDAIEQAIKVGYIETSLWANNNPPYFLADPLFWKSLGRARGWGNPISWLSGNRNDDWKEYAKAWFEIRLSGGDETAFWESLP